MDIFQPVDLFDEGISFDDTGLNNSDDTISDFKAEPDNAAPPIGESSSKEPSDEGGAIQSLESEEGLSERAETKEDDTGVPAEKVDQSFDALKPDIDDLKTTVEKTSAQLEELSQLFNKRILHTEYEERIVDQMHKELQKYKEDMYAQLIRPILMDIIDVRDSIMRIAATYMAKPEGEQNIPNKTFSGYSYDLQDILEKNNVEIYRSVAGDAFTPIKQRAVKKTPTNDQSLHGKIAESLSCGYNYNGRTISAEKVTVYYYEEPPKQENEEKSEVN